MKLWSDLLLEGFESAAGWCWKSQLEAFRTLWLNFALL